MGTFLKLPNELAFQIFGDLDNPALLALAKSCRHLNVIVPSYCLSRHHMPDPSDKIDLCLENDFDVLPFLRVSTLLTSSQDIHSSFTTSNYMDEIRGLKSLVDKLSSIRTAMLSLFFIPTFSFREDEARFAKAICGLITTIISRSCEVLCIEHGPSLKFSHHTGEQKAQHTTSSKLSLFVSPLRRIFQNPPVTENIGDIFSLHTFPASKLRTLRIYSATLFDHSFLHWTIHLINTSPITSLSIGNLFQTPFPWDDLLSGIHSPALSELSIADCFEQPPCSSVAAFFARHQTITSLECQRSSRDRLNDPEFFLPGLTRLISSYDSIIHLLDNVAAFPSLCYISLDASPSGYYLPFNSSMMNNALECLTRCPNELELSLRFRQEDEACISWLDVDSNDDGRIERLLHAIIALKLFVAKFAMKMLLILPKWLGLFPALRCLTFQSDRHDEMVPYDFAHSVIQACPQLETLTINEETHVVATWLAMED